MAEGGQQPILLNPPPTKKWVTFQDWDEESGLLPSTRRLRTNAAPRRHSCSSEPAVWTVLSSSVSSESSLGSAGEGGQQHRSGYVIGENKLNAAEEGPAGVEDDCNSARNSREVEGFDMEDYDEATLREPIFNASFGGYKLNGEAATMKTMWQQPPQRMSRTPRLSMSSSVSSVESEVAHSPLRKAASRTTSPTTAGGSGFPVVATAGIACTTVATNQQSSPLSSVGSETAHWLKFSAFDEVRSYEKTLAEAGPSNPVAGTRYSALEELREGSGGLYLGWSNHVLGAGPFAWSEHMKSRPNTLGLPSTSLPGRPPANCDSSGWAVLDLDSPGLTVETLSTPEMTGLRTISWPKSPTRTFVRNFP